ncbi:MAG TPA: phosphoribosylformylglycinamidine synthase subunit PurL [Pirellulaceae bacterium]
MTLWEVDIHPAAGEPDLLARAATSEAKDLGLPAFTAHAARGFLVQGQITQQQIDRIAHELLTDLVVEHPVVGKPGNVGPLLRKGLTHQTAPNLAADNSATDDSSTLIHILPKPGVTDPVAASTLTAIRDFDIPADAVVTLRKYWVSGLDEKQLELLTTKLLANDSIEQVIVGPLKIHEIHLGSPSRFELVTVPFRDLGDDELLALSKARTLSLTLVELQTVQQHYRELNREPTDIELETIAQTWSEHCSHKTLAGRVTYTDENGTQQFNNLLKETIFAATQQIRKSLGDNDWCVSVFKDNAGVIKFDDKFNVAFKVETHNRPSAIEPYGGANTGLGGVIRDTLGTGLGAKPICNTDVFCFAPPDTPASDLPPGVLHPRRIMNRVVAGVRDYGNRMGIPTVNGAVYFDDRYVGNPLVFCGDVGLLPKDKSFKETKPNDYIVALGGRTGRDGIHGATFSSVELTHESEKTSGGAVQIGNAITEKMVLDIMLKARDENLFNAVTDCGAGGFSSAVGEMGAEIGAEVWLERAPLKYDGLSYTEIWISEAQERMVLAVPEDKWPRLKALADSENVEATIIGRFAPTGSLELKFDGKSVGQLSMHFLHEGRPPVERKATYQPSAVGVARPSAVGAVLRGGPLPTERASTGVPGTPQRAFPTDFNSVLLSLLSSLNIASKEWIIRQYDHEVQGTSVIKPLVGATNDGPGDAAVIRPVLNSRRGVVISCGMNPNYGEFDTYHMAACAIDEAVRNCVAVGADPERIAILDNFCWGYTDRPETLGALVRAALACRDVAIAFGTPFISGKDSLNNEFSYEAGGERRTIKIPDTLLISAIGQIDDVRHCVTMDLKSPGNRLYQIGLTKHELSGSHYVGWAVPTTEQSVGTAHPTSSVPRVDLKAAPRIFHTLHKAITTNLIRSCHDLSEGGLAVALAEMAFAGSRGAKITLDNIPTDDSINRNSNDAQVALLFSESATRFLVEVAPDKVSAFENLFRAASIPFGHLGEVTTSNSLEIEGQSGAIVNLTLTVLKEAWQKPLRW